MSKDAPRRIDFQVHALVPTIEDLAPYLDPAWAIRFTTSDFRMPVCAVQVGAQIEGTSLPINAYDAKAASALLGADVELALVLAPQPLTVIGWLNHSMANVFCAAVNDYLISNWVSADPRFRIALAVSPHDPAAAAAEIRRHGDHPAVSAVALPAGSVNLGHQSLHPIYVEAEKRALAILVHPSGVDGTTFGTSTLGGVGPRTPEEIYSLIPQIAAANIASLIFEGTFVDFPDLMVVFAGFGFDWAVSVLWRMDLEWRGLRSEVPWVTSEPSEYVANNIRIVIDGASGTLGPEEWALAAMLPEKLLLWGSDLPYGSATTAEGVLSSGSPAADAILSGNGRSLLDRREFFVAAGEER